MIRKLTFFVILFLSITSFANAQYCTTGLYSSGCAAFGDQIVSFSTTGGTTNITNNGTNCAVANGYSNYTAMIHTANLSQTVNFSFTNGSDVEGYKIWVDWNQNTSFEDVGELMYASAGNIALGATVNSSFVVPPGATPGTTRMRIRCCFSNTTFTSCSAVTWGEVEDYGFTVINPVATDAAPVSLVTPLTSGCYTSTENVTLKIRNSGTTPLDFTANNVTVNVNVTGAITVPLSSLLTDNSLNGGVPLAVGDSLDIPMGVINMSATGIYTFNANIVLTGDGNTLNDNLSPAVNINISGGAANAAPSVCDGSSLAITLTGATTGGTIQWQESQDGIVWSNIPGAISNPFNYSPALGYSDTIYFRTVSCGLHTSSMDSVVIDFVTTPVSSNVTRCGVGSVSLIASGGSTMNWYNMSVGGSLIYSGDTLTTNVSSDTTFYVASGASGGSGGIVPLPPQVTTFSGNVRGMWFTAPANFTITGLQAPGTGLQNITVVRFNPAVAPPFFPTTTNAFDILYLTQNDPATGVIPVNIQINNGDVIGVMSQRGNVTSYANSPYNTTIAGQPATLSRLGMQLPLGTNPPQTLWQEAGGSIGLTEITYTVGCESNRVPVNVTVVPASPISLTSTATSICDVDTVTLSVASANTSYSYNWTPSTDLSATTGNPITAWPQSSITYVVSALDTANCAITDTISIAVAHAPTGVVTVSDNVTCYGDSVVLNAMASGGGSYNMTGPIVPIIDSNPIGCRDTIVVSGAQGTLASGDIVSVCIDITHTFDADCDIFLISPNGTQIELSTDNGGGGDNFTGTCFDMTSLNPITTGISPFTGSYIPEGSFDVFNGENANGNWQLWVVDDLGGDVGTVNNWTITFASYSYPVLWSSIPASLSDTNYTVNVNPLVSTTYIASITDSSNGCTRSYFDTVTVNPLPIVSLGLDTGICSNYAGIILDGTTANAVSYTWQDNQSNPTYYATLAGQYSLTVVDINGCIGSDVVNVGIIDALVVSIDANLVTIHSANLDAGPNFASYAWSTSANTQIVNVNTNGTYYVTCVDQAGCISTDTLTIIFSLGTFNPNGSETTLQLFPNPSQGSFNLNIENLETADLTLDVIDMNGKVIYNRSVGSVAGSLIQPFNLEDLRVGTYTLRVNANGKTTSLRFVISK